MDWTISYSAKQRRGKNRGQLAGIERRIVERRVGVVVTLSQCSVRRKPGPAE
jgi:hypothetical protein